MMAHGPWRSWAGGGRGCRAGPALQLDNDDEEQDEEQDEDSTMSAGVGEGRFPGGPASGDTSAGGEMRSRRWC